MPPMANYFKMRRLELRLSINKMSKKLRISSNTLKGWESFRVIPRAGFITVNMLAAAYEDSIKNIEAALTEQRRPLDEVADQNIAAKRRLEEKIGAL